MLPTITYVLLVACIAIFNVFPSKASELQTYIVHLESPQDQHFPQQQPDQLEEWYHSILSKIPSHTNEKPEMVYAYHHVFPGFAAKMSSEQVKMMEKLSGVVSVRPEAVYQRHTTRSSHFLGLRQDSGLWKNSNYGKGIIIGLLDGGIAPGHPSFGDNGVPPPPAKWKGKCEVAGCNNKLIGMRNFLKNSSSEVDEDGHGTHTSSTAAGNFIDNASVFGMANGTAIGMAPLAHVAMYQVCGFIYCPTNAILAGMDAAIGDGVDVLSISLGGFHFPYYNDETAIAAFSAINKGIFVSCSAGNSGPDNKSLSNEAPWILTVGASTIDRRIRTTVYLGNGKFFDGESLYQPKDFNQKLFRPLVYPGEKGNISAAACLNGSLDNFDVKGKVVLCDMGGIDNVEKGEVVKKAGGVAIIVVNDVISGESIAAEAHVLPASYVGYKEGVKIKRYLNTTSSPEATIIFKGTILGLKSDPQISDFTSRGPCFASPGILKPDITGPGVDILAAWPESIDNTTETKATFNVIEGTSMSCPHLAGIAALLKNAHPEWSPAAIKSAMMTTASQINRKRKAIIDERELPADVHAMGAGHVNPQRANDPGLIFDIQPDDYIPYLCGLNYTPKQVSKIVKKHVSCSKTIPEAELNYPSFVVSLKRGDTKTYSRTVTNVGNANSTYKVRDTSVPRGVNILVDKGSHELSFTALHQKLTYTVTFSRDIYDEEKPLFDQGHMTWVSDKHTVRTPFSFKFE